MKVTKIRGLLTCGALSMVLILASCSLSVGSQGGSSEKSNGGKITIVYATGKDTTGATKMMIDAFEKKYPNIHVKYRQMPADSGKQHDAYVTMLNAKSSEIDVFNIDTVWPAELAQAGYVYPLDRFIKKGHVDLSQYNNAAISAGQFNGKQWAIPLFIDVGLLFYRTDMVDAPPKTWDDLIAKAKKLKGEKGTDYGYLMQAKQYEGLVTNAVEFIYAYGGEILNDNGDVAVNSPGTIKGLKKMVEIANSDFVPRNITTFMETESHTAFIEGESPFMRNWPYAYSVANDNTQSKIAGNVAVAPLPEGDKGRASALGGWMVAMNKYSEHKKAAWKLLKFLTGPEGEKINAIKGSHAPAIMPLYKEKDVLAANPFFGEKGFLEGIKAAVPRPVVPNYQEVSEIIQIQVSKAIAKQETAEQAVRNMEKQLKAVLK
ncbi:carbohydrate ABC transporter substrate-binding protein (CUT1 family) [Scopulibacillus darangshiensis]|uniref:Carbohydrate ABC transporter substrate-binding protein (CUT1 family) n=1 Tax=Scopulibacillus darangshiensis TaxID=442528 RepID=A0A4R2NQ37_9BACL|nr:ABC transporter substrate-binding protein [Scopulibacillus darangshiensis]TCP23474.1 carbohydrate ABC transporter substrate-binding protein (CUT1 family) [Scopulibacillus darangshiensis]